MATENERGPLATDSTQAPMPAGAVFLSYASEDAAVAERIAAALRNAGIEVWFDRDEIRGGDAWDQKIRQQIKACALFIPVISRHAHNRIEGYFRLEWKLAVDRSHLIAPDQPFLLPVATDDTPQSDERIPDRFRELQWTRLPGGQTTPGFIERVQRLRLPEAPTAAAAAKVPPDFATAERSRKAVPSPWWSKPALWVIGAILVAALAYFVMDRVWLSKRTAAAAASAAPASATAPETSIAVLPFVDMSEKHDQEYFGDGMAEEILNLLAQIPELKVIGRTSSFQFKGKNDDLRKVGAALGAVYILEGSVRRNAQRIRLTAQLIDTRDGAHRWSQSYDRDVQDAISVQDDVAGNVVRAVQVEVASLPARARPRNSEAYEHYLRGLHYWDRFDEQGFNDAIAEFQQALLADPSFAPASERLALARYGLAQWGFVPPKKAYEDTRAAALAALKLDARSVYAHDVLGLVHLEYDWDWPAAAQELATARSISPNFPDVLLATAQEQVALGRWADAMRSIDAAIAGDPMDASAHQIRSWVYLRAGRLPEAEKAARRTLEISPTYAWGHYGLARVLLLEGKNDAALTEIGKETMPEGRDLGLVIAYTALSRSNDARAAFVRFKNETQWSLGYAYAYAAFNQIDLAFSWLDQSYADKENDLCYLKGDPFLKKLEADPRYKAFLRKMKLPE